MYFQAANLRSNIHDEATQAFPSDSPDHAAVSGSKFNLD